MKSSRYFSVLITFVLVASLTIIVSLSVHAQTTNSCQQSGVVCFDNQELFTIKANFYPYTPDWRAERITETIQNIANNYSISIDSIKVEEGYGTNNIMVEEIILVIVTDADARAARLNRKSLADRWLQKIKASIENYRKNQRTSSIKDNIASFWNSYIKPNYLIIIIFTSIVVGLGLFYVFAAAIYFYLLKDKKNDICVKKRLNSIRNRWRKCQQEQWVNHLSQSASQIRKFTKIINKFVIKWTGIGIEIIVFFIILILIVRLIFVIYYNNFDLTTDELEKLRKHIATLLNIIGLLLLFGVVSVLLHWLSSSREGTVVLPFDDTTAPLSEEPNNKSKGISNQGKAIADSLVEELHRISYIYTILSQTIKTGEEKIELQRLGKFNFPPLTSSQENIESNLTDVATFEAGKTSFSLGRIILTIKLLWPFGGVNRVISGSLQTYGSTTRLVVRLDYQSEVKAWEVTWENYQKEPMTEKIKDLAYKVAMYLAPDITAQTWYGFKFYTEAIYDYYQYQQTGSLEHLNNAEDKCKKAYQEERKFEKLDDLFYKIGRAYIEEKLYYPAERAFQSSLKINPKSEYSYTGLGNVYYAQDKLDDAINKYKLAKRVNKDFPYSYNGLGNVYFQQGDYEKALEQYKDACDKNEKYWHDHFWKPYHNLGLIFLYGDEEKLTDYEKAKEKFQKARCVNKHLKDAQELHTVHSGLALAYLFQANEDFSKQQKSKKKLLFIIKTILFLTRRSIISFFYFYILQIYSLKFSDYTVIDRILLSISVQQIDRPNLMVLTLWINVYQVWQEIKLEQYELEKEIKSNLKHSTENIQKATDIALETQAYIYWNLGLITLAQGKIAENKIKVDEVCDAWEKALKVSPNQSDKLCIEIYKYAIDALNKPNFASKFALLKCINHPLYCMKKGWLKVMLKDVTIISKFLDENNNSINDLISILKKTIEKKDKQ